MNDADTLIDEKDPLDLIKEGFNQNTSLSASTMERNIGMAKMVLGIGVMLQRVMSGIEHQNTI